MLILVGASASGKTEIAKLLIKNYNFEKLVTSTTRIKRENEVDGVDYNFLTPEQFFAKKEVNGFFESVIYNDNYYGTPIECNDNNVLIVDPIGANTISRKSEGHTIVVLTTEESVRKERMLSRGDSLSQCTKRLRNDKEHFRLEKIKHYDHLIDTTDKTLEELTVIINDLYKKTL